MQSISAIDYIIYGTIFFQQDASSEGFTPEIAFTEVIAFSIIIIFALVLASAILMAFPHGQVL
jgi:hypothetical protein